MIVFIGMTKPNRKFRIDQVWNYHKKNYNDKHAIEDEQLDINKTKKKPGISVKKVKKIKTVEVKKK